MHRCRKRNIAMQVSCSADTHHVCVSFQHCCTRG